MRSLVVSAALAAGFVLAPVAGYHPAWSQDFDITNKVAPVDAGRRDLVRQLQAWWDLHAFYPRHASQNDEGGNLKLHLVIYADGRIWSVKVVDSSGSNSLDAAGTSAFRGGFVRAFPTGAADTEIDVTLHYVLAHRHDQPVAAGYTPVASRGAFTIANDPVRSPILEAMLQRTCTGAVVKQGIRNHSSYGVSYWAQAVFFRKPDGTPWVKFYEGGYPILAPVTEIGKQVQWTGREERGKSGSSRFTQYTVWPDGENNLVGNIGTPYDADNTDVNQGGTVDFKCATEVVPPVEWSAWSVNRIQLPTSDPP